MNEKELIKEYESILNKIKGYEYVKIYGETPTRFDYTNQIIQELKENEKHFNVLNSVSYDVEVAHEESYGYEWCDTHKDVQLEDVISLVYEEDVINSDYVVGCLKISIKPTNTEFEHIDFCNLYENGEALLYYTDLYKLIENIYLL